MKEISRDGGDSIIINKKEVKKIYTGIHTISDRIDGIACWDIFGREIFPV
jgi:hypothetical protein